jgi:hypothetical protein
VEVRTVKDTVTPLARWLARLLSAGGILEAGAGLMLLVLPSQIADAVLRLPLDPAGQALARIGGAGLLALGAACWYARDTPLTTAALGVARAFLVYNVVASVTLALVFLPLSSGNPVVVGASALHGLLAVALLVALMRARRAVRAR